jgi:hypothetical protein
MDNRHGYKRENAATLDGATPSFFGPPRMSTFVDMFHVERRRLLECRAEYHIHIELNNNY